MESLNIMWNLNILNKRSISETMKRYILFLILSIFTTSTYVQGQNNGNARKQRWEEMKAKRTAFYTERIGLTAEEAQAFWPLYNELQEKKGELHRSMSAQFHNSKRNGNKKRVIDYTKATDDMINLRVYEATLEKSYHEKFKAVLPPEKLFRYYRAERDWANQLLKDIEKRGDK